MPAYQLIAAGVSISVTDWYRGLDVMTCEDILLIKQVGLEMDSAAAGQPVAGVYGESTARTLLGQRT